MDKLIKFNQEILNCKNNKALALLPIFHYKYFVNEKDYNNLKGSFFAKHFVKERNDHQYRIYSLDNLSNKNDNLKGNFSNIITEPILYQLIDEKSFYHILDISGDGLSVSLMIQLIAYSVIHKNDVSWSAYFDSNILNYMVESIFNDGEDTSLVLDNVAHFTGISKLQFLAQFITKIFKDNKTFILSLTIDQKKKLLNELL